MVHGSGGWSLCSWKVTQRKQGQKEAGSQSCEHWICYWFQQGRLLQKQSIIPISFKFSCLLSRLGCDSMIKNLSIWANIEFSHEFIKSRESSPGSFHAAQSSGALGLDLPCSALSHCSLCSHSPNIQPAQEEMSLWQRLQVLLEALKSFLSHLPCRMSFPFLSALTAMLSA